MIDIKGFEAKQIDGFSNYYVSPAGEVFSANRKIILKQGQTTSGYKFVILRKDGKNHCKKIHRLVAEAFVPNPNNLATVHHKDHSKVNNSVFNLEWASNHSNVSESFERTPVRNIFGRNGRPVICVETGIIYNSAREASIEVGLYPTTISNHIRQNCKSKGLTYKYIV